jgi:hypothetical protein
MKKSLLGGALVLTMLAPGLAALAAVNLTNLTFNGNPNVTVDKLQDFTGKLTLSITANQDVESVSYEYVGLGAGPVCVDVEDQLQNGPRYVYVDMQAPNYSGPWDVIVKTFGVSGVGADQQCATAPSDTMTFGNVVHVNAQNTVPPAPTPSPTPSPAPSSPPATSTLELQLKDIAASLNAIMLILKGGAPGSSSQVCKDLMVYSGLTFGSRGQQVTQLQVYLIQHGGQIPAITQGGAAYGYFGNQTMAALFNLKSASGCN